MIKYLLAKIGVTVTLEATQPDESAIWTAEGDPILAEIARRDLLDQYGAYGHLITESTTPLDLEVAMNSEKMKGYRPKVVEGQEIIANLVKNKSKLPKGALT